MQQTDEKTFYYLGQPFVLRIMEQQPGSSKQTKRVKKSCLLEFTQSNDRSVKDAKACLNIYWSDGFGKPQPLVLRNLLVEWFRQRAKHVIPDRVRKWSHVMNLSYNRVTLKDQKTRWGSCSSLRNLNFNWRLIMAPIEVLDYVVIHELAHLQEMNHSQKFWKIVEENCPEYRLHKDWLKKHGAMLFAV